MDASFHTNDGRDFITTKYTDIRIRSDIDARSVDSDLTTVPASNVRRETLSPTSSERNMSDRRQTNPTPAELVESLLITFPDEGARMEMAQHLSVRMNRYYREGTAIPPSGAIEKLFIDDPTATQLDLARRVQFAFNFPTSSITRDEMVSACRVIVSELERRLRPLQELNLRLSDVSSSLSGSADRNFAQVAERPPTPDARVSAGEEANVAPVAALAVNAAPSRENHVAAPVAALGDNAVAAVDENNAAPVAVVAEQAGTSLLRRSLEAVSPFNLAAQYDGDGESGSEKLSHSTLGMKLEDSSSGD